jgi:hypothetical protein
VSPSAESNNPFDPSPLVPGAVAAGVGVGAGRAARPPMLGPLKSIVQDLQDKSRGATPLATPGGERANPFVKPVVVPAAAAPHHGPSRHTQRRPARMATRSSVDTDAGADAQRFHVEPNPHCNGGLHNALLSVKDRVRRALWVGTLGSATDAFSEWTRTEVDRTAIHQALTMDAAEASARWEDLHAHVAAQSAQTFVTAFLQRTLRAAIEHARTGGDGDADAAGVCLERSLVQTRYRHSAARLLLLDLEATLWRGRDPRKKVDDEEVPEPVRAVLRRLADEARNEVWVLSGLTTALLDKLAAAVPAVGIVYARCLLSDGVAGADVCAQRG